MKTSFYFVLWIIIYPVLGLINNSFIDNHAFIVALGIVWGLSWLLNRLMPNIWAYESVSQVAPILEDVYIGNVNSFRKRLSRDSLIETITSIYFLITTMVIGIAIFLAGVNDWIALMVFLFFTFGAISRSVKLIKAKIQLSSNPTPEQCMEIATETYKLDYSAYYEAHFNKSYMEILPPKPRYFNLFRIFSIIIAALASLLGLINIVSAVLLFYSYTSIEIGAFSGMYFLYGSLATYFGIKDIVTLVK